MDPGLSAAADRVLSDVLSEFAFLFGDPVATKDLPSLQGKSFLARLPFRGGAAGSVDLAVPEALALQIAANTLGIEATDPEVSRKAQDALKEVASVMGGHLATSLTGPAAAVELLPPELVALEAEEWKRLSADPETHCFAVNEHPVLLRVELKRGGATT